MFSREDVYGVLAVGFVLYVLTMQKHSELDTQSKLPTIEDSVMLVQNVGRHRIKAKVQWHYDKPYCSPHSDNSGMGLLLPQGRIDGVGSCCAWEPLTPSMSKYFTSSTSEID